MKAKIITLLILMISVAGTSFAETPKVSAGTYDPAGETITVVAKGLVCDFCAKALEKVILDQDGVSGINVDLTTKEIMINLKGGAAMSDETVKKLVVDAGYNVVSIARNKGTK